MASKRIENRIPNVVKIDIIEAVTSRNLMISSLTLVDLFFDSNMLKSNLLKYNFEEVYFELITV